jgi:hypothetical protein
MGQHQNSGMQRQRSDCGPLVDRRDANADADRHPQSLTVPQGTVWATICIETANARWRDEGTAPTATVGQPLTSGQCMQYSGPFVAFQLIAQTGSPVATISYYR